MCAAVSLLSKCPTLLAFTASATRYRNNSFEYFEAKYGFFFQQTSAPLRIGAIRGLYLNFYRLRQRSASCSVVQPCACSSYRLAPAVFTKPGTARGPLGINTVSSLCQVLALSRKVTLPAGDRVNITATSITTSAAK